MAQHFRLFIRAEEVMAATETKAVLSSFGVCANGWCKLSADLEQLGSSHSRTPVLGAKALTPYTKRKKDS